MPCLQKQFRKSNNKKPVLAKRGNESEPILGGHCCSADTFGLQMQKKSGLARIGELSESH